MIYKKNFSYLIFCILFFHGISVASGLIKGDEDAAEGTTFSFSLDAYKMSRMANRFYVTVSPSAAGSSGAFAISQLIRGKTAFDPMAPEMVTLNGVYAQNPLYNAGINFLSLLEVMGDSVTPNFHYPVVVTSDKPDEIYLIDKSTDLESISIISARGILDAAGNPISEIAYMTAGGTSSIFAAVKNNAGEDFGQPGSGVSHLLFVPAVIDGKKINLLMRGNTVALDRSSSVVAIGDVANSLDISDMYWDNSLNRLYIALQTESGNLSGGAKVLVVGRFEGKNLVLQEIAPNTVFDDNSKIVGTAFAATPVSLHKVRTMFTSTLWHYAIVLGGNGEPEDTMRQVYALPLVNNSTDNEVHGTLANKNAGYVDVFSGSKELLFKSRLVKEQAVTPAQAVTVGDAVAVVGGGQMFAGDIVDIFIYGDTVYAVVAEPADDQTSGIFMSRALFAENGSVKRWTNWTRVADSAQTIFGAELDPFYGNFLLLSGADEDHVNTVKQTFWGKGSQDGFQDLGNILNGAFGSDIGGLQGLREFPYGQLAHISLLVATGLKKVVLAEMGREDVPGGTFVRNTGDFPALQFTHGRITENFPVDSTRAITISGGALDDLGPVVTSEIAESDGTKRLFVGGVNGLAMLVDENDGAGWDAATGLGPNFEGLTDQMKFITVGSFSFVKKIIHDGQFLYVLTDSALYRIDLESGGNDFAQGILDTTEIANGLSFAGMGDHGILLDCVVSERLAIVATSSGLFRVGNGKDVSVDDVLAWIRVPVPCGFGPVTQLLPFSKSLREQDFARDGMDGMLYVLNAYSGKNSASINRFSIQSGEIDDDTVSPLPDFFIQDKKIGTGSYCYYLGFSRFRNTVEEDGALKFSAADKDACTCAYLALLNPRLSSGARIIELTTNKLPLPTDCETDIVKILRSSTGSVLVGGSFGIMFNE